jgi:hypothetical protein
MAHGDPVKSQSDYGMKKAQKTVSSYLSSDI